MVFSSLIFLYGFLPLCVGAYALFPKARNLVLVISSLVFYAWGEPVRIVFLLLSAAINYLLAFGIGKKRGSPRAKLLLCLSLFYNLGMLVVFKYAGFFVENLNAIGGLSLTVPEIPQMIGISFYTFQVLSYVVDCYWETVEPQRNPLKFLLYVSLFPQLIAGPIVRYATIAEEIENRRVTLKDVSEGATRLCIGLGKKVILADSLYQIVENLFEDNVANLTVLGTWYAVIIYSLYIYFDFSGYSDMAIGMGRMFGFHFLENFDHPFLCQSITEFWQRWHISLGSFFRDYLLPIPVFGIRNMYLSLMVVWACTGLWHGASWNYVLWGLYYGLFLMLETAIGKKKMKRIPLVIRHIYNKIVIIIGFGIFYFEDFTELCIFFKNITPWNTNGFVSTVECISLCNHLFLIIVALACTFPLMGITERLSQKSEKWQITISTCGSIACVGILVLSSILLVDTTTNAFLYYRF